MSKYAARDPATGEYADITWRKPSNQSGIYLVFLGSNRLGEIHKLGDGWAAITHGECKGFRSVSGFKTRWKATEYILRGAGIWNEDKL